MCLNFKNMKLSIVWLAALAVMLIASCSTNKVFVDDMYYDLSDADREYRTQQARKQQAENLSKQAETVKPDYEADQNGNIVIRNDYADDSQFAFDDYYDYAYSARIRRFGSGYNTWSYYDPYYTNLYWYNPYSYNWGVSIYQTYGWWGASPTWPYGYMGPGYVIVYQWGNSWGWNNPYCYSGWGNSYWWNNPWHNHYSYNWWNPYNPWQYSGWNNPWQYGYWNGYNNGYYNGYYNGLAMGNLYFNSYDNNSYYYGPRYTSTNRTTFSFAKTMQDEGLGRDIAANRIENVPVSSVDRNKNTLVNETITNDPTTPIHNTTKDTRKNNDATIIRNYDNKVIDNKAITNDKNTMPRGKETPTNNNNNNTYRQWNTGGRENFNIERKQDGVQRSSTFMEGSRTYDNNSEFFNNRGNSNMPQQNNTQPNTTTPRNSQDTPTHRSR